jgi:transglutaminase-like putative cysteine protease
MTPVNLADLVDVLAPAHAIYWGGRMQALALPRLNEGDAIEIETYRKGFQIAYLDNGSETNAGGTGQGAADGQAGTGQEDKYIPPMEGHFYDVVLFQGRVPIIEKSYTVHTPKDKPIQFSVYNGEVFSKVTFDDERFSYKFWKRDVPAAKSEWRSAGFSDYAPKVVLATVQDWYEKSRWFWEANQNQFADNEEIHQKVTEITAGLKTDAEKIAAINHWVAQEIRYCGLNMGQGEGYTLHPGDMIFTERSGVCKDIAGMTITMLRSAGYEVYPAMTMAGSRVERIPADQFNHCVAALRRSDGTFELLDPTWIPFAMYNWSRAEGEQNYVIGTPTGEDLAITPAYRPEDNQVTIELDAEVTADGTLAGSLKLQAAGYADTRLRRSVGFVPKSQIRPRLERWLATLSPAAELVSYEFGDHRDFSVPLALKLEFRIAGYATVGQTRVILQPCAARLVLGNYGGLFRFAARDLPVERTLPALIWYPQKVSIDETIAIPKGYHPQSLPGDWQAGADTDIASCSFSHHAGKKQHTIAGTIRVEKRTIPPEDWPAFRAAIQMLQDLGTMKIVAKRKGA